MKANFFFLLFILSYSIAWSQIPPDVIIEPVSINNLPGLQAYAYGKHNGKWIILGGRTDGLHQRQPFAAFSASGNNLSIYVVDPIANQVWSSPISSLAAEIGEQLQSTNMQFYQTDTILYLVGGYGYSATAADHITYPNLTAVNLPGLVSAIVSGGGITSNFRQITNQFLAVTGGHLGKIGDTYYLTVGNRFDGRYNPMGNPTYTQTYTNAIRKFKIDDNGSSMLLTDTSSYRDALQLHRRDYNLVPQVFTNGSIGYTIFSGVFQPTADLPFLNCVDFDSTGFVANNNFNQYLNHYHCPNFGAYDATANQMHSFFFGGISQYYMNQSGTLVQDNNVPFVNTIARVSRNDNSVMTETKLSVEMPALLGAGAELILQDTLPLYENDVIKLNQLSTDTVLVGHIYGGISSSAANIFFSNTGAQSSAASNVFRVYLVLHSAVTGIKTKSENTLEMNTYTVHGNPGTIKVLCSGVSFEDGSVLIQNMQGQILKNVPIHSFSLKQNTWEMQIETGLPMGVYVVSVAAGGFIKSKKLIIE